MNTSLFARLGGAKAITAVVDDFINRAAMNPKVNFLRNGKYSGIQIDIHKKKLAEFIAVATGGPNEYNDLELQQAHAGMGITTSEFDALASDLLATLNEFNVPEKEKNELMVLVGNTRAVIVEK